MDEIGFSVRGLDDIAMASALDGGERGIFTGQDVLVGMGLILTIERARSGEGTGVVIGRAALGREQIIPAIALIKVRALDQLEVGALIDIGDRADELAGNRIEFLQHDAGKEQGPHAMVPGHVDEPFLPVVIMEEAGVKA
jgi:hypothetical protein